MRCAVAVSTTLMLASVALAAEMRELPVKEYEAKVYASWLGQCVGNMYGLAHENRYVEDPYPGEAPPSHYAEYILKRMGTANGAFSDDDTDLEYMDLVCMEEKGPEPTYKDLADRWRRHVWHHIWVANRSARTLMAEGYEPPVTGMKGYNGNWFQIDPQLINEIFAVTAPGMVHYAAEKSDWAARITNDDFGTHPTIWYGAMYAAAFFETDVGKLYDAGMAEVPEGRFRDALVLCKLLHEAHPDDWRAARRVVRDMYYTHEPAETRHMVAAVLNGALGALALLYGEGDFHQTLNYACMMGMDADNQAATLSGLVALSRGVECIPESLLNPPEFPAWKKPLNDMYRNFTRENLPDGTLTDIAHRMVAVGKQQVQLAGGEIRKSTRGEVLVIPVDAEFIAPMEARLMSPATFRMGREVESRIIVVGGRGRARMLEIGGALPRGLSIETDHLVGRPLEAGEFAIRIEAVDESTPPRQRTLEIPLRVLGKNLAAEASVIAAVTAPTGSGARSLEVLTNGITRGEGQSYDSFDGDNEAAEDWYGLVWENPKKVSRLRFVQGRIFDNGGAWDTLGVQYRDSRGRWRAVKGLEVDPYYLESDAQEALCSFWPYTLTFDAVETSAIRLHGKPAGRAAFTSITELEAYE